MATGILEDASPYNCYIQCLMQNVIEAGRPLTVGLSEGKICLCGLEPSK